MKKQSQSPRASGTSGRLGIIFLTLFLDLAGFSIIFPLFPSMLEYYLPHGEGGESALGRLIHRLNNLAEASGAADPKFMTTVLFGGILGSLYSLLQFISAPLWGAYSDRVGRRKVLLITTAGMAGSYAVWLFGASFWILIGARVLGGIMGGNLSVATAAVADITSREKRSSGLALVGIAFGLGFIVGPAIGGLFALIDLTQLAPQLTAIGIHPFSAPAFISLILALLNFIWIFRSFNETLPESKRNLPDSKRKSLLVFRIFRSPNPSIRRTNLVYLVYMLAFSGMEFTLSFLAVERFAFSPTQNGGMFVFIGLILIFVQGGIVRQLAGPIGEKRLALTGLLFGLVAFFSLALALKLGAFFGALTLMAFSIGLVSPTMSALVSLYSNESDQGLNLGVFRSAGSLARVVGPLAAAFAYFVYGSQSSYFFGALLLLIPLSMAITLPKPKSHKTAANTA